MIKKKSCLVSLVVVVMIMAGIASAAIRIDRTGSFEISYSSQIGSNENGERVFDDTQETKWLTAGGEITGWIQYDFSEEDAFAIDGYTIKSANDSPERSPKNWTLEGSDDGNSWTVVDTQTDEIDWVVFELRSYSFTNTTAYKIYKLNVTANNGADNLMGFSELELLEGIIDRTSMPGTITGSSQIDVKESAVAIFDNTDQTKWLTNDTTTGWVEFDFTDDVAYEINGYTITSANDSPERTPKNWTLEGANDGIWTVVDTRTDETGWNTFEKRSYYFSNTTAYKKYRLNMSANNGSGDLMGLSELELLKIIDDAQIISMSPDNFNAISANPLVLKWDTIFNTTSAMYTVHFGTDPNFLDAGSLEETGIMANEWTVPEASITDDSVYYWRVDVVDDPHGTGIQTFTGPVVKFRVFRQTQKVLEWSMDSLGEETVYSYESSIQDVTATASSIESGGRNADNTTGPGLIITPTILDPNGLGHSNNADGMWISNPDQTGDVWIQYAFDKAYQLGTMLIWNHNVGEPHLDELNRGMSNVSITYSNVDSTNPNDWTTLGNYEIPMGTGQYDMAPSIAIAFNGIEAQYVRITGVAPYSNWGANGHHALSEVRFGLYNQLVTSYVMPDTSGNGNDGITYNNPELASNAIAGTAIDLTGDDMVYMDHTDPNFIPTLPLGGTEDCYDSWSMNFYAMLPIAPPSISFVVGFGDFEMGTGRYICQFADGIHFWGGADIDGVTNVPFDLNRYQMITTTYENGTLRIYKNGEEILSQPTNLGIAIPKVSVSGITNWGTVPSSVVGLMDEFTIYKGALSQTEIDNLVALLPTDYAALNPVVADGTVNAQIDPVLMWDAPLSAIDPTYTVYLGTDENNLPAIASDLTETMLDTIELGLTYGSTYYWYVDTSTGDPGEVWSFTTMPESFAPSLSLGWDFENLTKYNQQYEQAIKNVVISSSSEEGDNRVDDHAANEIGLFTNPYISDPNGFGLQHSNNPGHAWISHPDETGDVWIKFNFDQSFQLGTMFVWNHNLGDPHLDELNRGMRNVSVLYSDIDSSEPNDWNKLGDYEIPMGTGQNGMSPSIAIPFDGIEAQYVMIIAADSIANPDSNSNWGATGNFHALSEVRFGIYGTTAISNVVPDTSGNGNVGIVSGTPKFVPGLPSSQCVQIGSLNIENYGDQIDADITNAEALPLGADDPWSMNLYVYLPDAPSSSPTLLAGFGDSDDGTGRFIGYFDNIHLWGGHHTDLATNEQYRYGHWQMVTVTYSTSELSLYHNGIKIASGSPDFIDAAESVNIAGLYPWGSSNTRMNGLVDNFALYSGVLNRTEIMALAAAIPMEGDMDWNGTVDTLDLSDFFADWLMPYNRTSPSDLTGDGYVTLEDFAVVAENWLKLQ